RVVMGRFSWCPEGTRWLCCVRRASHGGGATDTHGGPMGGNLVVNGVELDESYGKLTWLKSEFDSIESRNSDTRGIWGNDKLRDAMHEFATNMKHHRKELAQKIEDTRKKIESSQEAFE